MNVAYPFAIDRRGRTETTPDDEHVRDMIEQVLFTSPGERVNRPTFGSGVMELVFAPNNEALAAALQLSVQAALQQWLGDWIEVGSVEIANEDSRLLVDVSYTMRQSRQQRVVRLEREV
jgi:phage baseplate assembly protein W